MEKYISLNKTNLIIIHNQDIDDLILIKKEKINNYIRNRDLFKRSDFLTMFDNYIEKNKINNYKDLETKNYLLIDKILSNRSGIYDVLKLEDLCKNYNLIYNQDFKKFNETMEKINNNKISGFAYKINNLHIEFLSDSKDSLININNEALKRAFKYNKNKIEEYNSINSKFYIDLLKVEFDNDSSIIEELNPVIRNILNARKEKENIESVLNNEISENKNKKRNRL